MGRKIRIAIVGVGNCASSLLQGIEYYRHARKEERTEPVGLMHYDLGGYTPADIETVCAFDIDERKVGHSLAEAAFAKPNNTTLIWPDLPCANVIVHMGPVLDGVSPHMEDYPEERRFIVAQRPAVEVAQVLKDSQAEILLNYLPVGSQQAAEYYARACLDVGVSLVNCMPVFLVSQAAWAEAFLHRGIPVVGDDIKSQLGATILHRTLLSSKKRSKTEAVQSILPEPLPADQVHIGPSDYVPWQEDKKVGFLRLEGRIFGNIPIEIEVRLAVEDSPNSAGVVIDVIRCCQLARDRGISGPLTSVAAYFMKHPPQQFPDAEAHTQVECF